MKYLQNLKQTGFQLLARILSSGSAFAASILIAHYLGFSTYGEFIKLLTVIGILYVFLDFGLNTVFLQVDQEEKYPQLFLLRLIIASTLFLLFVILIKSPFFSQEIQNNGWILGLTLFPYAIQLSIIPYLQKRLQFDRISISYGIGSIATAIFVFVVWQKNLGLPYILGGYFFGTLIGAITGLLFVRLKNWNLYLDRVFLLSIFKKSIPLGLMVFCNLLYFRIDVLILASLRSIGDVSIYGFAYKFFEFFIAIPLFLSNTIFPSLLNTKKTIGRVKLEKSQIGLFFFVSLFIVLFGWFIPLFFPLIKPEFVGAGLPFRILLVSLPFFFLSSLLQWILIAEDDQWMLVAIYISTGMLNALLNFAFIPSGSYTAAAVITGISELVVLVLLFMRYKTLQKKYD